MMLLKRGKKTIFHISVYGNGFCSVDYLIEMLHLIAVSRVWSCAGGLSSKLQLLVLLKLKIKLFNYKLISSAVLLKGMNEGFWSASQSNSQPEYFRSRAQL